MTTTNKTRSRPLSPHVGIWRWSATMASSIFHRATGVGNAIGTLLLTWWLIALATGPGAYTTFANFVASPLGRLFLFGFTLSLSYHMLNGVRHLFWDAGKGFDVTRAGNLTWVIMIASLLLSVGVWFLGYEMMGGMV